MRSIPQLIGHFLKNEVNALKGALSVLTRIPVAHADRGHIPAVCTSARYFPLVGMLVALITWSLGIVLLPLFPPILAALGCLLGGILITGALHEDGLADTADGLIGGSTVESRLAAMKDSRLGTYGALGLWFALTAKLLALEALISQGTSIFLSGLLISHALGRFSCVALIFQLPYLQTAASKFSLPGCSIGWTTIAFGFALPAILPFLLVDARLGGLCLGAAGVTIWGMAYYCNAKLAGVTGDCLGAASQVTELACYIPFILKIPNQPASFH